MFDAGFLEMMVIGVIALLIVGPERLPGVARKAGAFIARAKAFVSTTRADIEKELRAEEMKSMLSKQSAEIEELKNMMHDTQRTIHQETSGIEAQIAERAASSASASDLTDDDFEPAQKKPDVDKPKAQS